MTIFNFLIVASLFISTISHGMDDPKNILREMNEKSKKVEMYTETLEKVRRDGLGVIHTGVIKVLTGAGPERLINDEIEKINLELDYLQQSLVLKNLGLKEDIVTINKDIAHYRNQIRAEEVKIKSIDEGNDPYTTAPFNMMLKTISLGNYGVRDMVTSKIARGKKRLAELEEKRNGIVDPFARKLFVSEDSNQTVTENQPTNGNTGFVPAQYGTPSSKNGNTLNMVPFNPQGFVVKVNAINESTLRDAKQLVNINNKIYVIQEATVEDIIKATDLSGCDVDGQVAIHGDNAEKQAIIEQIRKTIGYMSDYMLEDQISDYKLEVDRIANDQDISIEKLKWCLGSLQLILEDQRRSN